MPRLPAIKLSAWWPALFGALGHIFLGSAEVFGLFIYLLMSIEHLVSVSSCFFFFSILCLFFFFFFLPTICVFPIYGTYVWRSIERTPSFLLLIPFFFIVCLMMMIVCDRGGRRRGWRRWCRRRRRWCWTRPIRGNVPLCVCMCVCMLGTMNHFFFPFQFSFVVPRS